MSSAGFEISFLPNDLAEFIIVFSQIAKVLIRPHKHASLLVYAALLGEQDKTQSRFPQMLNDIYTSLLTFFIR